MSAPQPGNKHTQQQASAVVATLRSVLERCVPVMIDGEAVKALLTYIDDTAQGLGDIGDEVPTPVDSGLKLLQVSDWLILTCFNLVH